jgi:hypothetical protein
MFENPLFAWILVLVVIVEGFFILRLLVCCKKAKEAWAGVDALTKYIKDTLIPGLTLKFQQCGCQADPNWPPEDPPIFPPTEGET